MKTIKFTLVALFLLTVQSICAESLEKGVSKQLAERRKAAISNVKYNLTFNVPADAKVTFLGSEFSQIGFTWGVRGFLLALVVLLNIAIYYADTTS